MKQAYWDLDLIRLSAENKAVHLDNEFILIDNLDETSEKRNTDVEFVNHPVKLSFTIVIFCLSGYMSVQINLQNFELHSNDVLIVQEGAIGEYLGISDDAKIAVMAFSSEYFQPTLHVEAAMSLQRRLYVSPLHHLTPEAMEESMTIYWLMKSKVAEVDNPFRKGALLGYTQVPINICSQPNRIARSLPVRATDSKKFILNLSTKSRKVIGMNVVSCITLTLCA